MEIGKWSVISVNNPELVSHKNIKQYIINKYCRLVILMV